MVPVVGGWERESKCKVKNAKYKITVARAKITAARYFEFCVVVLHFTLYAVR